MFVFISNKEKKVICPSIHYLSWFILDEAARKEWEWEKKANEISTKKSDIRSLAITTIKPIKGKQRILARLMSDYHNTKVWY